MDDKKARQLVRDSLECTDLYCGAKKSLGTVYENLAESLTLWQVFGKSLEGQHGHPALFICCYTVAVIESMISMLDALAKRNTEGEKQIVDISHKFEETIGKEKFSKLIEQCENN